MWTRIFWPLAEWVKVFWPDVTGGTPAPPAVSTIEAALICDMRAVHPKICFVTAYPNLSAFTTARAEVGAMTPEYPSIGPMQSARCS
jgi:hypothetical protein